MDTDGLGVTTRTVCVLSCGLVVDVFAVALGFDLIRVFCTPSIGSPA